MGDPRSSRSTARRFTTTWWGRRWLPAATRIVAATGVSLMLVVAAIDTALADPSPPSSPSSPMGDVPAIWAGAPARDDPAWEPDFTEPRPLQTPTSSWFPTAPKTQPVEIPAEAPAANAPEPAPQPADDLTLPQTTQPQVTGPEETPETSPPPPAAPEETPREEPTDESTRGTSHETAPEVKAPETKAPEKETKPTPQKQTKPTPEKQTPKKDAPKKKAPKKEASNKAIGGSQRDKALALAADLTGIPYVWGGTSMRGFDCSGYVQHVFGRAGLKLPRTAAQQQRATRRVSDPRPGDLVFFGSPAHHVGIYAGSGRMYDAPRTGRTTGLHRIWSKSVTYGRP